MNKKILAVFVVFIALFGAFYVMIIMNDNKDKEEPEIESNSNVSSNLIGDVSSIKLYFTDYKYDVNIKGYNYTEVTLTEEQITKLKEALKNVDLNKTVFGTVYGQYKLVADDKIIFFDPENNYGLYMGTNKEIEFSNDIKKIVVNNSNNCSCCTTSNCNIKLCECKS